jgi:hypothetical protein
MQPAIILLLVGLSGEPTDSSSAPSSASPTEGGERYILLDNNRISSGRVTEKGEDYLVERRGARVVVPKWRTQVVADSLEEIYRYRSQRIPVNDVPMRADFARWCFEQGLVDFAVAECQLILSLDPSNDTARRVMKLCKPEPKVAHDRPASGTNTTRARLRQPDPARVVGHFKSAYGQDLFDEYKRMEPMLRQSCGSSACHGSRHEGVFRIYSRTNSTGTDIGLTARNLRSLIDSIDYSDPQRSPILYKSLERHGSSSLAPLGGVQDPTYIQLQEWVHEVAHRWSGNEIPLDAQEGEELAAKAEPDDGSFAQGRRITESKRYVRRTGRPERPGMLPGDEMPGMSAGMAAADDSPAPPVEKMSDPAADDGSVAESKDSSRSTWPEKRTNIEGKISARQMAEPVATTEPMGIKPPSPGPVRRAMNRFVDMVGGRPRFKTSIPIEGNKRGEVFEAAPPPLSLQQDFLNQNEVLDNNVPSPE